jgi:gluconolactonase
MKRGHGARVAAGIGTVLAVAAGAVLAAGCDKVMGGELPDGYVADAPRSDASDVYGIAMLVREDGTGTAPAGSTVSVVVQARDAYGQGVPGASVTALVTKGGGAVATARVVADATGHASFDWILGVAPVAQELALAWGSVVLPVAVDATRDSPLAPGDFGDVDGFLSAQSVDGSTEDLAFAPDGLALVLGVPGGLVELDATGQASTVALTGDPLGWVLGLAYDADGVLWGADANGKALVRVGTDGVVAKVAAQAGDGGFGYPNDLAVLPGGFVAVADTCLGKVLVFRPDGTKVSEGVFDTKTEGGANGLAVDPAGAALWVTTENAALLCGDGADPATMNGGLYRFALAADGTLGARTTVKAGLAHYADGITFDAEGNLFVMVDRMAEDYTLAESAVEVLPAGGSALRPFLRATDRALANGAFGTDAFGKTTLYVALVAIPLLVDPAMRGVMRIDAGIGGAPLVPAK